MEANNAAQEQIESEIADLAIVEKSHVNRNGSVFVAFNCKEIPESFNSEMISKGFAIAKTVKTESDGPAVTYKNITDF